MRAMFGSRTTVFTGRQPTHNRRYLMSTLSPPTSSSLGPRQFSSRNDMIVDLSAVTISVLSGLASIFVLAYYFLVLRRLVPKTVDRVSLRLAVAISLADLGYSIAQIINVVAYITGAACAVSILFYMFFCLLPLVLTACIALNLQLLFLVERARDTRTYEIWYYVGSILISVTLPIIGFVVQRSGIDHEVGICLFYDADIPLSVLRLWEWVVYFMYVSMVLFYTAVIVLSVGLKLWKNIRILSATIKAGRHSSSSSIIAPSTTDLVDAKISTDLKTVLNELNSSEESDQRKRTIVRLKFIIARCITYLIIPFFTQVPILIVSMIRFAPFGLYLTCVILNASQGMLNAIAFFVFDPDVRHGSRQILVAFKNRGDMYPASIMGCIRWIFFISQKDFLPSKETSSERMSEERMDALAEESRLSLELSNDDNDTAVFQDTPSLFAQLKDDSSISPIQRPVDAVTPTSPVSPRRRKESIASRQSIFVEVNDPWHWITEVNYPSHGNSYHIDL